MKILYLHHVSEVSGAEQSLRLLFRHLDRSAVEPLFGGAPQGAFAQALIGDGMTIQPIAFGRLRNAPMLMRTVMRIVRLVRAHGIDLLHANGPQSNFPAGLAGALCRIPVVWHARSPLYDGMWDVDRFCAVLATRIVCNSDAVRERFRESRAWGKSVTLLNAVDLRQFNPEVPREPFRREQRLAQDDVAIGIVGRIGYKKGYEEFVETAIRLLRAGSNATFFVVGEAIFPSDAWRVEALHRQVKDAGMDDRIRFLGYRKDVASVLQGLDVLVHASEQDACSRVLCEALASGAAIVATESGGTPELVRDGREGILVPPGDVPALADGIQRLMSAPALRAQFGSAGAARAREHFGIGRYVNDMMAIYEAALRS